METLWLIRRTICARTIIKLPSKRVEQPKNKKAALDRFPKLQQKAAADLYSSIQETDPALLKREVDVMPGETDADKMTAYMNRGYLPRFVDQIRAELRANISGLLKRRSRYRCGSSRSNRQRLQSFGIAGFGNR